MLDEFDAIGMYCLNASMEADVIPNGLESDALQQLRITVNEEGANERRIQFVWPPGTWKIGWSVRGGPRWTPWYWEITQDEKGLSFKGVLVLRSKAMIDAFEKQILMNRAKYSMPETG